MLRCVEEAGRGIAARALPARNDGAGRWVEPAIDLGVEAETGQPALHVATFSLVETDPIFVFLGCFVGKDRRIDGGRQSRLVVLGPALAASVRTRIPRIDNARIKTRMGCPSLI